MRVRGLKQALHPLVKGVRGLKVKGVEGGVG